MFREQIIKAIQKASGAEVVELEFPEQDAFGDYSSNVALKGKSPRLVAEGIKEKLKKDPDLAKIVEKIEIAGPGFINFWLHSDLLIDNLISIGKEKEKYGHSKIGNGKTVIIDYSSPNIAKPFGIGHLRSTVIGQALYNLYKALGYEVIGDNHLGDWGTQFGKLLYMIDRENVTKFDIDKLEKLYVEFHKLAEDDPGLEQKARGWFKKLEDGDNEARSIWQKCVEVSMKEFGRIYELLGVKIDFAFGESYYESEMKQLMEDPEVIRHLEEGEGGAKIIDLSKAGIKIPLMFLKADGATTYATRDLATLKFRKRKWNPDIVVYEVGVEQTLHFQQVFAAAELLGIISNNTKLVHTGHGLYLATDGKKFSTRKGKTVKLEEVLDEAIERAGKLQKEDQEPAFVDTTARQVGIGAIKYYDLMHSVQSDVVFDWEKMMNLEGNSGPYLQYTVARCNSVMEKSHSFKGQSLNNKDTNVIQKEPDFQGNTLKGLQGKLNQREMSLLRDMTRFGEIISLSATLFSPNFLCNYLYNLAQKFNTFYSADRIVGSDNESLRLAITSATGQILKNGLKILGIMTPEKM